MKNFILTLTFLMIAITASIAQNKNRIDVIVHLKNGEKVETMATINPNTPWSYQKTITTYDRSLVNEKRIKAKQKTKYKASKVTAVEYDGRYFESKKLLVPAGNHGSTLKGLPSYALVERVLDGKVNAYRVYSYPPSVASGITFEEIYSDIRANPNYFVIKNEGKKPKLKNVNMINIEKWVKDAPITSEKLANGELGNFKRKEGKKLGNFIKGQIENENPMLIVNILEEYNIEMAKE